MVLKNYSPSLQTKTEFLVVFALCCFVIRYLSCFKVGVLAGSSMFKLSCLTPVHCAGLLVFLIIKVEPMFEGHFPLLFKYNGNFFLTRGQRRINAAKIKKRGSAGPAQINDLKGVSVISCLQLYPESRNFLFIFVVLPTASSLPLCPLYFSNFQSRAEMLSSITEQGLQFSGTPKNWNVNYEKIKELIKAAIS